MTAFQSATGAALSNGGNAPELSASSPFVAISHAIVETEPDPSKRSSGAEEHAGRLPRPLGLGSATALVVASMIGTGVFTTSGFLLADLGSPWVVLLVWLLGGMVALLGAMSYGALARRIPESGGEYIFLARTLHPAAGYVAGWISLLVGFSAPLAAAAYAFGEYTKTWFNDVSPKWSGSLLILLFTAVHAAHVQRGARIQDGTVLLKIGLIVALVGFGLANIDAPENAPAMTGSLSTFAVSLVWVSFSYSGWNAGIYIGSEVRDPERNVPRSLWLGAGLVAVLYVALNAVFVFAAPASELAGKLEVGRIAAEALGGASLREAVTALIALALVTSVSSMLMAGPRVYARMAVDGYLPRCLAVSEGPPRAAIAVQATLALVMLWTTAFKSLLTYIGFTLGLSTAATVVGLLVLRRREGVHIRVPGGPAIPWLFLVVVLAMTTLSIARQPVESLAGFGTIALGWLVWKIQRWWRETEG